MTRWLWQRATRDMTLGGFSLVTGALLARFITTSAVSLIWVSGCFLTPFPVQSADAANVEAVRLWRAPDHTRVVLDLTSAADFSSLSSGKPRPVCRGFEEESHHSIAQWIASGRYADQAGPLGDSQRHRPEAGF